MTKKSLSKKALRGESAVEAVVIGASAGAVEALSTLLPAIPAGSTLPLMIVVHLPPDRHSALPELYQPKCAVRVVEAQDKELIEPGTIYFAPPNYHLLIEHDRRLSLSNDDPVLYSRPSVDVLFESAADAFGSGLLGIVLTGANSDGAHGLRAIADNGGTTVVQTPQTAQSSTMPQAALDACPNARTMSLQQIADYLRSLTTIKDS